MDEDVLSCDVSNAARIFTEVSSTPKHAKVVRASCALTFPLYDSDSRESFQIPEIRCYVQQLDRLVPHLLYFLDPTPELAQVFMWMACLADDVQIEVQEGTQIGLAVDVEQVASLLYDRLVAVEKFCDQILDDSRLVIQGILSSDSAVIRYASLLYAKRQFLRHTGSIE
jgi:hypothetical protein